MNGSGTATAKVPDSDQTMKLYYSGGDEHREGVGFMLSNRVVATIAAFQPVSSRIAVISVCGTVTVHILCIYAPTEMSPESVKDELYGQLQRVVDAIPQSELVLIAGDFHAHVDADRQGWERTLGRFGVEEVNDNGSRLLSFATTNKPVIGNSHVQHPREHQMTWRNPMGHDSTVLDYVLISSRFISSLKDVRAMRGPDCRSDHYLLRAVMQPRLKRTTSKSHRVPKLDWSSLITPPFQQLFQIALSNRFATLAMGTNANEEEEQMSDVVLECAKSLCPVIRCRTQPWISNECLQLVDKRKQAKLVNFNRYRQLNRGTPSTNENGEGGILEPSGRRT
ncbi:hypothetical protein Y032_0849g2673 [Ancylostoma ceylanicum]|uniref:Endonuclease/exonuclease/phosphatase domain-containing protein n=1 Tax=Ancylostoma ceylanicum TaxID=53326 RepID=A0A016WC36_9BILA|nr:hypothetical protein Y032_0849g2673 [Ancylostoma ceylanicum]